MQSVKAPTLSISMDSELELCWLAGLLEGEGSFVKGPPSKPRCPIVRLPMTDRDVVEHVARLFARAVTPWDRRSAQPRKRVYTTSIKGSTAVLVMRNLYPLMGTRRRRQIDAVLSLPLPPALRSRIGDAVCGVAACVHPVRSKGLCRKHYGSWWKSSRRGRISRYTPVDLLPPAAARSSTVVVTPPEDLRSVVWLAGLMEGEGTFADAGGYPYIRAEMCDRDVLKRAAAILGIQTVRPKSVTRNAERGWSPAFEIGIAGARAAEWMRTLRPLMGRRRRSQIDHALAAYHPIRLTKAPERCVVNGCRNEHRGRGLCHRHYMSWMRDAKRGRTPRVTPLR